MSRAKVSILRLGHRIRRDQRVTTHCGLVARAFGADCMFYSGQQDKKIENSIKDVVLRWGGDFKVSYVKNWKKFLSEWKGTKVHLTMYGLPLPNVLKRMKKGNLLVILGGEKVPAEVYELADLNVSITNQPHSEIAALAVFLDRFFNGKEFSLEFENAKLRIIPQQKGKKIIKI